MTVVLKLHILNKKDQPHIVGKLHSGWRRVQTLIQLELISHGPMFTISK